MRLIDSDALKKAMYHEAFEKDTDLQKWDSGCWIRYKMFENKIEEAPTVDAVEQKHGHWIRTNKTIRKAGEPEAYCSNCGRPVSYYIENDRYWFDKWCSGCGAKMDEVI